MTYNKLNKFNGKKSLIVLGVLSVISRGQAFNYQQYNRSFSLVFDKIEDARLDESYVNSQSDFLYMMGVSYVDAPLVAKSNNLNTQKTTLLENMTSLNFGFASYVNPWLMLGANTSYSFFKDNNGITASGFNDVQVLTKFRVINERRWAMSIIPYVTIPTAGANYNVLNSGVPSIEGQRINVLSDQDFGWGVKFSTEFLTRYIQFAANVGYKFNERAVVYYNTGARANDMTQQLLTGFGAYVPLHKSFGLSAEYMRLWSNPFFTSQINPNEFMLTASAGLSESVNGFAGFALGNLVTHDDGNDYRVTVGLKVAPCMWGVICKKDKGQKLESVQVEKAPGVELVEAYSPPSLPPPLPPPPPPPPPPPVVTNKLEFKNDSSMFTGEEVVESSNVAEQLPVNVSDSEVTYVVRYPQNIAFISMKDRARLKKVLLNLKGDLANIKAIKIVGHASAEGASEMNKEISYMRAVMMKNELRKEGIPASKIQMGYFGSDQPSEADLPANRRVELQVVR